MKGGTQGKLVERSTLSPCKPEQRPVRIDLYGVIMILPHGLPRTCGGTLRRTFRTALWSYDSLAKGDRQYPLSPGLRGKYGENASKRNSSAAPKSRLLYRTSATFGAAVSLK